MNLSVGRKFKIKFQVVKMIEIDKFLGLVWEILRGGP